MEFDDLYEAKLGDLLTEPLERRMLEFLVKDDPVNNSKSKVITNSINAMFMYQVLEDRPEPTDAWSLFAILGVLDFWWDCEDAFTEEQNNYRSGLIPKVYELVAPLCKTDTQSPPLIDWLGKIKYFSHHLPLDIAEWWDRLPEEERLDPEEVWLGIPVLDAKEC